MKKLTLFFLVLALSGCSHTATSSKSMNKNKDQKAKIEASTESMDNNKDQKAEIESSTKSSIKNTQNPPKAVNSNYIDVSVQDAKKIIENVPNLIIIDVSPKYAEGHIPGAVNYYIGSDIFNRTIPTLDKETPYLVYCHTDTASIAGAKALIGVGIKTVLRLKGNYNAWVEAGYDIEK